MIYITNSEKETFELGKTIANKTKSGYIFLVNGELGVGKSVLIRGIAAGLGIQEPMPSPTFTIVNEYIGKEKIYHFDLYRINEPFELFEIGFEEYIYSNAVIFIEWPSKAGDLLPSSERCIRIDIKIKDNDKREIIIEGFNEKG
ncbi:MAG TPA: tRNA (adenosine(37)-N6)-threonylcarbamoyltransferase complex ATPase subunit type 1 TsaE [Spirochaetota bacterium]|nr:tRNA (adenosine(37)-N6)-threonylcarbamoyltransferase complex ATPase subunit type 1 TsaE [Spirochaetota bacterium]HOL57737.1 tRNA (adenosine(37)-N6)-threonylcarbamoyltransferase complex ATPase subunit type 1 TsaE [Spirochaetota bacterium]HPP05303.1 tRNA (adenosine(37)-N6)-threonylcarbamoyltransferase complex ATPase subunit type 1 TsaE [Spirochaetota bacterium]